MNTSKVGEISTAQVLAALVALGKKVWLPWGDSNRADLLIEEEDGGYWRVQCKTGRLVKGAILFPTSSFHAPSRTGLEKTDRRPYREQVDFFGVYCRQTEQVYLVPVADVRDNWGSMRVCPPKNNQKTRIRWASQYEIGAVAQLGARQSGTLEVTGSIPVGSTPN